MIVLPRNDEGAFWVTRLLRGTIGCSMSPDAAMDAEHWGSATFQKGCRGIRVRFIMR